MITDIIIIVLLVMIWLQGTKYPDQLAYKFRHTLKVWKQRHK